MSDKAIRDELEKLREQVAGLHSTRIEQKAQQEPEKKIVASQRSDQTADSNPEQTTTLVEDEETSDVEQQIRDFVDALDQEILLEANIENTETVISVSNDDEVNILKSIIRNTFSRFSPNFYLHHR